MVNYYNLKKIDVSSKDGYIDSNDEHFGEKLYAGLMSRNIVEWRIDFTLDDPDVWYHYGATISKILKNQYGISGVDKPTRAIKDGLEYCIADFDYYLKNATQDQVQRPC